jgi:hypothetical protein
LQPSTAPLDGFDLEGHVGEDIVEEVGGRCRGPGVTGLADNPMIKRSAASTEIPTRASPIDVRRHLRGAKRNVNDVARHENVVVIDDRFGRIWISLSNDLYCSLRVFFTSV